MRYWSANKLQEKFGKRTHRNEQHEASWRYGCVKEKPLLCDGIQA